MKGLIIRSIGGHFPVQAEGTINGTPFYFRSRHEHWSMSIGPNPIDICGGYADGWHKEVVYGNGASWMEVNEVRKLIKKCAREYIRENNMKKKSILSFNVVNKKGESTPMKIAISNKVLRIIGRSVIKEKSNG